MRCATGLLPTKKLGRGQGISRDYPAYKDARTIRNKMAVELIANEIIKVVIGSKACWRKFSSYR